MGNTMLDNRRQHLETGYIIARELWKQLISDVVTEIVYDDQFMGDKVFTPEECLRLNIELEKRIDFYEAALGTNLSNDADVKRSRLDDNMKLLVDDYNATRPEGAPELPFIPFEKRYIGVEKIVYDKPIREERHPAAKKHKKRKH